MTTDLDRAISALEAGEPQYLALVHVDVLGTLRDYRELKQLIGELSSLVEEAEDLI